MSRLSTFQRTPQDGVARDVTSRGRKMKKNKSRHRAAGYSRTSGISQKDNTSIPRQKEAIERFIERQGWIFVSHYVDECKSGANVAGRDDFQRMMKDAAKDKFDIIVPYDATRFARDGLDILNSAKFLKDNYGKYVVDTRNTFDNLTKNNVIKNFVHAGLSEYERLNILTRTKGGIIANAKAGLPWTGSYIVGRTFIWTDKKRRQGKWKISERGEIIKKILERFDRGESLRALVKEFGISSPQIIYQAVRNGQLSGIYKVKFTSKEKDLDVEGLNEPIPVPAIPEVIPPELEKRVKERLEHNRRFTKKKDEYPLSGFLYCAQCSYALTGQTVKKRKSGIVVYKYVNYRHNQESHLRKCTFCGVHGDKIEPAVLDYLYNSFLDEPTYMKAVKAKLPSKEDRKAAEKDLEQVEKQIRSVNVKLNNISDELERGDFDRNDLLKRQKQRKAEQIALFNRRDELQETLDNMPDPKVVDREARAWQKYLKWRIRKRNWRTLPYEDIQKYLHFLFSENPKKNGFGIFVNKKDSQFHITFKGRFDFNHVIVDGQKVPQSVLKLHELHKRLKPGIPKAKVKEFEKDFKSLEKIVQEYATTLEKAESLEQLVEKIEAIESDIELEEVEIERLKQSLKPESGNEFSLPMSRSK